MFYNKRMIVLLISAFLIRLINLNQSLWLDESIVAKVAHTIPLLRIPTTLSIFDVHPPGYYMIISVWSSLFGTSEIALRMPSIIMSLLAGWFIYKAGMALKDKTTGLWASAFFLFNPLIIYYSQEARMHMMATAFLSGALYYFVLVMQEKKKTETKNFLFFNIFSVLSMSVFYGSAFFLAAMLITYLFVIPMKIGIQKNNSEKSKSDWIPTFVGMTRMMFSMTWGLLISLLLLSPLLYLQMQNAKAGLADLANWTAALGKAELKNIAMIFLKFATGRLSWLPKWSYYLVAGVPTMIVWMAVFLGGLKKRFLGALLIIPLILGLAVSFIAPMMMYFRFLYLIPVMCLLIALFAIPTQKGKLTVFLRMGIMLLFLTFSLSYLLISQFHREDWKGLAGQLQGSAPVFMIIPSSDPIGYYRPDVPVYELRSIQKTEIPEYVYVVPYTAALYGIDHYALLEKKGCMKASETHFRGDLILEKWTCLKNA